MGATVDWAPLYQAGAIMGAGWLVATAGIVAIYLRRSWGRRMARLLRQLERRA